MLIYNHHDDWDVDGDYEIDLQVENLPFEQQTLTLKHYRIDHAHSNAYAEWVRQGKPMYPSAGQRAAIKAREGLELLEPPQEITAEHGKVTLTFSMPVHSISLLVFSIER